MFNKITKFSLFIWLLCVIGVLLLLGYVVGIRHETFDHTPNIFSYTLLTLLVLGSAAFMIALISFIVQALNKIFSQKQNIIIFLLKLIFILPIFPLYLLVYVLKPSTRSKNILSTIVAISYIILVLLPVWAGGYIIAGTMAISAVGYSNEAIDISGTGSMYPTFPKGQGKDPKELGKEIVGSPGMLPYPNGLFIFNKRFFEYQLARGDIVVVENDKTRESSQEMYGRPSGWVKRIIALSGDSLEIRDGIVYLNGEPLKEPYIAQARSTFGEAFLSECKKIIVPADSVFVMGDNRKGSGDSREVGFFKISDINHVLPLKSQAGLYDKAWRDTSRDFDESSKIKLDIEKYLALLNQKRQEVGAKPIKYQPKLELSAKKRGEVIIKYDDFSFEATKSGYTMAKAMRESNYSNIVYGEAPTQGYFDETELIDNQFEFPESIKFLTDKTYQEVGIAEVQGEINGCPTQVIVQHFAGYIPPNYKKENIESWRSVLNSLKSIQGSWQQVKGRGKVYEEHKADYDRINEIIATRIANIQAVVDKMDKNQWLTDAQVAYTYHDLDLYTEQESLAIKLNNL